MGNAFHRTTAVPANVEVDIDEIVQEVLELDRHFHSPERWFGSTGGVAPGSQSSLTGFRVTTSATANGFGTAIQVFDGTETPADSGMVLFDLHRIHVVNVETNGKIYRLRFASNMLGHTSWADAVAAKVYTDVVFKIDFTNADSMPISVQTCRCNTGDIVWAAIARADNGASWVDFLVGIHEYPPF